MFKTYHRRRKQEKTDYPKRLSLLRSGKTRLIVRRSLEGIMVQFIDYIPEGDQTKASAVAADLKKFGWKIHTGNTPASYLVGLIAGLRAKAAGVDDVILDTGLQTSTRGSRIYAALKGVVDSGVNVAHSEDILPDESRISGDHIAKFAKSLDAEKKKKLFSKYISAGVNPEDVSKHFSDTKKKIIDAKGVNR